MIDKKTNILIYTTFGISKSIVRSEYLWLKNLIVELKKKYDINLYFESYFSKELSKTKRLKEFEIILDHSLIKYDDQDIDHVFFTAIPPPSFFGGLMNERDINNWVNLVKFSHKSKVYLRVSDSEQSWINIRNFFINRFSKLTKFENLNSSNVHIEDQKFFDNNQLAQKLIDLPELNWSNIYPLLNGNLTKWEYKYFITNQNQKYREDVPFHDISQNTIYLTDDLFFLIRENNKLVNYNEVHNNKLLFVGFISGHNKSREKVLSEYLDIPLYIQTDTSGSLKPTIAEINDVKIPGDNKNYFDFINKHLAGFFIGKGKKESLDYINKSIYDFLIAKIPILIWEEVDKKHSIFPNINCYFTDKQSLLEYMELLKNENYRKELYNLQKDCVFDKLETIDKKINNPQHKGGLF